MTAATPARATEHLRQQNTAHVLRVLRASGPATRTELAHRTGLSNATVGTIVAALELAGTVEEAGPLSAGRGRPGRPISLTRSVVGLGFEVNVDYVSAVAIDLSGRIVWRQSRPVTLQPPTPSALADFAQSAGSELRAAGHRIAGASVAVPGLVADDRATVVWAPNLQWDGCELASRVSAAIGEQVSVTIDNDANCAAQAEASDGAAIDQANLVYVTGTVGIGAGIIHDHQLVRGGGGFAGEVGHLPVGDPSAVCGCGRTGCWEASIGLRVMLAAVGMRDDQSPLDSAKAVALRAETDPDVRGELERIGVHLGAGLAAIGSMLDPSVFVLGGYFVPLGSYMVPTATEVLESRLPTAEHRAPRILMSKLGLHAAALGAAEQALSGVFRGEQALD